MQYSISSNRLTIRYGLYQIIHFAACAGYSAFAATYLLEKGFSASQVGTILAATNIISCILQPMMGDRIDRMKKFILPQLISIFLIGAVVCFAVIQFFHPPLMVFGVLYAIAVLLISLTTALNNSMCVYYTEHGHPINYGIGSGLGSLSFSIMSLVFGYIIALLGVDWMIWFVMLFWIVMIIIMRGYPKVEDKVEKASLKENVSLFVFFGKYKYFNITMIGVGLIAMCHFMVENYLINLFQSIGGNSENVGIALFVACITATPFLLSFERIQEKVSVRILMRTAGLFYILKAGLMIFATEIWHVYLIQLLQIFTYGFINPSLYYYVKQRVSEGDMVKGQAVAVVTFTFGTALGSFVGGQAIDLFGIDAMLLTALLLAAAGTIIINLNVNRVEKQR